MKNLSPCFASGSSCSTAAHFWMWWHALVENPERLRGMVDNRTTLCKKEKLFSLLTCILLAETAITSHQGISWPSHAKNLPLSLFLTLSMMERSFCTENSLVKSLSLGTFLWKGRERSVSTVPGCSRIQANVVLPAKLYRHCLRHRMARVNNFRNQIMVDKLYLHNQ